MKRTVQYVLQIISFSGLLLTILPPVFYFSGAITKDSQNLLMLIGALLWFAGATFWLGRKTVDRSE